MPTESLAGRRARAALSALPPDRDRDADVIVHGPVTVWDTLAALHPDLDPDQLLATHIARGWRLICPGDDDWPTSLPPAGPAPIALWARGHSDLTALTARAVAITGSRNPTPDGIAAATRLATDLAHTAPPVTVAAPMLRGIAHAALTAAAAHGPTLAILTTPQLTNRTPAPGLIAVVAETGLVLTDAPPLWTPPTPRTPVDRYRHTTARINLLATLTHATLCLECTSTDNTIRTARVALSLGRPVLTTPTSGRNADTTQDLLRGGVAFPVTTAADIATHLPPTP